MAAAERWSALLEILARDGRILIEPTAAELGVSAATVRRDLDELARQQLAVRTRGGAVASAVSYELPLRYKESRHAERKQRIAAAAAELVAPGAVVGLNGGTTTTEVARALVARRSATAGPIPVTVVTNALNIANELVVRQHAKTVVTGGVARPSSYELVGPLAEQLLAEVALEDAILGVDAIDAASGVYAHHEGEAAVNRLMVRRARRVIVVADASKLAARAFARICPIDQVDILVTDVSADPDALQPLVEAGVRVVTA